MRLEPIIQLNLKYNKIFYYNLNWGRNKEYRTRTRFRLVSNIYINLRIILILGLFLELYFYLRNIGLEPILILCVKQMLYQLSKSLSKIYKYLYLYIYICVEYEKRFYIAHCRFPYSNCISTSQ